MSLTPFTLVEMEGMSVVTATWFMFITVGMGIAGGAMIHWMLREFSSVSKRLDKHSEDICLTNSKHDDDMKEVYHTLSSLNDNVVVTKSIVEHINARLGKD